MPLVVAVPRHEPLQFVVLGGELEKPIDDLRLARVQQRQKWRDLGEGEREHVQRSEKRLVNLVKQDPGRVRQNS